MTNFLELFSGDNSITMTEVIEKKKSNPKSWIEPDSLSITKKLLSSNINPTFKSRSYTKDNELIFVFSISKNSRDQFDALN